MKVRRLRSRRQSPRLHLHVLCIEAEPIFGAFPSTDKQSTLLCGINSLATLSGRYRTGRIMPGFSEG